MTHVCNCGSGREWADLRYVGIQTVEDDTLDGAIELRNCPDCHTTLARELSPEDQKPNTEHRDSAK